MGVKVCLADSNNQIYAFQNNQSHKTIFVEITYLTRKPAFLDSYYPKTHLCLHEHLPCLLGNSIILDSFAIKSDGVFVDNIQEHRQ